jgi:F-type H+-transporting ATPase subunit epsilon
MADTFLLEIITPEETRLREKVEMVVLPAQDGQIGLLPGHAPLITALEAGMVQVYRNGVVAQEVSISGGFAEMTGTVCTILSAG